MVSYKLYLVTCVGVMLFAAITCKSEILQCNSEVHYSPNCTISSANIMEATEFQIQRPNYGQQITRLKFIESRVWYIPHGIFTNLPYLHWIDFSDCGMREVIRYDFMPANSLIDINLSFNQLDVLKDSIFYGANSVQQINLSHNKITVVSNSTFQNLNSLNRINLSYNRIKKIASSVFTNLYALRYIDLSRNLIETITADDSYANMTLTEFDLSYNTIVDVDQRAFVDTKLIKLLDLNSNKVIKLNFSDAAINIDTLWIRDNNLTELQTNNNLLKLDASYNQLTSANLIIGRDLVKLTLANNLINNLNFIKPLTKLNDLDVSFNQLDNNLAPDTFTQLTKLQILSLESVNLKEIDFQLFAELNQLTFLDISYNGLASINFHMLSFLEKLQHLYIDGNRLTQLVLDDFELLFPNLQRIGISENNWLCSDLSVLLKRFKQLNIEIFIDASRVVKDGANIRGIQCNDQNATSDGIFSPKTPIVHNHTGLNYNYMLEINQTRIRLEMLEMENDVLKLDLNRVRLQLDNITNAAPNINAGNVSAINYIAQITNLTEMYNGEINSIKARINNMQSDQMLPSTLDQGYMGSIISNLIFIKILLITFLVIGMVCGAIKFYTNLRYRRIYRPAYNTMADVINENNI